jgi:hypothetical protein
MQPANPPPLKQPTRRQSIGGIFMPGSRRTMQLKRLKSFQRINFDHKGLG